MGFRGLGFRAHCLGFRVQGLKLIGARGLWSEVESLGFGNEGRSFGFALGGRTV